MIILLDEGHGGIKDGAYQTKGKKMYTFAEHTDEGGNPHTIYEGALNREYGARIKELLKEAGHDVIRVAHDYSDTSLADRVSIANAVHKVRECVYLSIHNNAASDNLKGKGSTAVGTEVWTSPGQTESDKVADSITQGIKEQMPNRVMRTDKTDGDSDKEALFYVLKETACPAVLVEIGFFDNWDEVLKLYTPDFKEKMCRGIAEGIIKYIKDGNIN